MKAMKRLERAGERVGGRQSRSTGKQVVSAAAYGLQQGALDVRGEVEWARRWCRLPNGLESLSLSHSPARAVYTAIRGFLP